MVCGRLRSSDKESENELKQRDSRFYCEEAISGFSRMVLLVLDDAQHPVEDFATSQTC